MKIVVTGTRGIPGILGGVETHCEELFPRIAAKSKCDVTVIRRKSYVQDDLKEYKGVRLIDIETPRKKSFEAIIHTLRAVRKAKKLKADIVHIHAIGPALVTPLARLFGLKVIFTHHGPDYDRDKWGKAAKFMLRMGERMGVKYANEVIVISNVINDIIKNKYGRKDAHLIYNGVSEPRFISDLDNDYFDTLGIKPKQYIFAMGRFVPEKNFHQLISAFASIRQNDCKLVLAGDADFEDNYSAGLKKKASDNGVILTGFIKGFKLHTLLTHARVFVLPSSHEGLPISLLEAMSYNLSVVVSNIPANVEVGLPAESYFQVGDEEMLAKKLQDVMEKESVRIEYFMDNYSWDTIASQTLRLYEKQVKR